MADRERLEAFMARERDYAARGVRRGREPKTAAQTPVNSNGGLLPVDHRLLQQLASYGPHSYPGVPELAGKLGCSDRWVQKRLDHLERCGLVYREPVFERPDDGNWVERDRRITRLNRQTSNRYWLVSEFTPPGELTNQLPEPDTRSSDPGELRNKPGRAGQTPVHPYEQPRSDHQPVQGQGSEPGAQHDEFTGVEPAPWPEGPDGHLLPLELHAPEGERLDHDPTASGLLATLRAGLGEAQVLGTVANDDPAAAAKLDQLAGRTATLPSGWRWRGQWSDDPIGRCVRCNRTAHTPGPDGRPWHAFCWGQPALPPATRRRRKRGHR